MNTLNIGLFGGTFNPPHLGHLALAKDFYKAAGLDLLIVMPSFIPPHKASYKIDPAHRLHMTKLLCLALGEEGLHYTVNDYEIQKGDVRYTIETVEHLLEAYHVETLSLCVGSDMFLCFESWKCAEKLMKRCHLYTKERVPGEKAVLESFAETLRARYGARCTVLDKSALEVSSTDLRDGECEELLSQNVKDYIEKYNLYGGE